MLSVATKMTKISPRRGGKKWPEDEDDDEEEEGRGRGRGGEEEEVGVPMWRKSGRLFMKVP